MDVVHAAGNIPPANLFEGAWEVAADYADQERAGGEFHFSVIFLFHHVPPGSFSLSQGVLAFNATTTRTFCDYLECTRLFPLLPMMPSLIVDDSHFL